MACVRALILLTDMGRMFDESCYVQGSGLGAVGLFALYSFQEKLVSMSCGSFMPTENK